MRTTIEIGDGHRAKLLELAARRGEKGFSVLIAEALDAYFAADAAAGKRRDAALSARGALRQEQAEDLRARCAALHEAWR